MSMFDSLAIELVEKISNNLRFVDAINFKLYLQNCTVHYKRKRQLKNTCQSCRSWTHGKCIYCLYGNRTYRVHNSKKRGLYTKHIKGVYQRKILANAKIYGKNKRFNMFLKPIKRPWNKKNKIDIPRAIEILDNHPRRFICLKSVMIITKLPRNFILEHFKCKLTTNDTKFKNYRFKVFMFKTRDVIDDFNKLL